ncbi:MAG: hypothetical protein E7214_12530 [Clostridium sp.]|nr:hypothetical protein [Clostridium sp.]
MKVVTMGPKGSCHENAVYKYMKYHEIDEFEVIFVMDFLDGLEMIKNDEADILVQCSAHLTVHTVTEKYCNEIKVMDTFIYPTKDIVLLENKNIEKPKTLGLVKATEGYLGDIKYDEIIYETTKPIVGKGLCEGKYDAGVTTMEYYDDNKEKFRIRKRIGNVLTTWIVYGKHHTFKGEVMSTLPKGALKY